MSDKGAKPKKQQRNSKRGQRNSKRGQKNSKSTGCKQCNTGFGISYKRLTELLTERPNSILLVLISCDKCLVDLLNLPMKFNMLFLFSKILKKCQQCTLQKCFKHLILKLSQSKFLINACTVIKELDRSDQMSFDLFIIFISILKSIISANINQNINILQIMPLLKIMLHAFSQMNYQGLEKLQQDFHELTMLIQNAPIPQKSTVLISLDSPENFRTIPIIPTSEELESNTKPFLRKNKINEKYDSVEEYLDTQFRLLREDFIGPLRDGIHEYKSEKDKNKKKKIDNIYIYNNVHISSVTISMDGILYELKFDIIKVNWKESKRLIYGSLVCLSCDNFKTIYFATVAERNLKLLGNGKIQVKFLSKPLAFDSTYVMIETVAFFEAYKHVLHGMQQLSSTTLPFQEYIVYGQKDVKLPKYLTQDTDITLDLTCLKSETQSFKNKILLNPHDNKWPSAEELGLNEAQCSALCKALTKEFSLTQGPPGTGKTFLGLKIIKVLCRNSRIWQSKRKSPILIVCYINHALDQFLEGVAKFLSRGIVRVGGRSKSEILKEYFLSNVKNNGITSVILKRMKNDTKDNLSGIMNDIKVLHSLLENKKNITDEDILKAYMQHFYFWLCKCFHRTNNISRLQQWLQNSWKPNTDEESLKSTEEVEESEDADSETEIDILENERKLQHEVFDSLTQCKFKKQLLPNILWIPDKKSQKKIRKELFSGEEMSLEESEKLTFIDFQEMELSRRWRLYRRWFSAYKKAIQEKCVELEETFNEELKLLNDLKEEENKEILSRASVVGMTTTCAARLQPVLKDISPKIILVEEAAHVLEGHIVVSLNPFCEHLILIGDHQQLQPSSQNYTLEKEYKLNISLFERMVKNDLAVDCLTTQHRMRPEIAQILYPIYDNLKNDDSVKMYENIKGIDTNIFFVDHEVFEDQLTSLSHSNEHEAHFIVALCIYLLKQGYSPSQITILTTYSAQLFKVKKLLAEKFPKVLVANIDNYQGEENDIILLTLVRSNASRNIGFLKVSNRVCVALSRAKKGLYIIGNSKILAERSQLWQTIIDMLRINNKIDTSLILRCQIHTDTIVNVADVKDFDSVPEGGCVKKCNTHLKCGHFCSLYCHPYDRGHKEYKCQVKIFQIREDCAFQHELFEECYKRDKPCPVSMEKIVPKCQHRQVMKCSDNPAKFFCREICQKTLPCGHLCRGYCGGCLQNERHPQCMEECKNVHSCGHKCPLHCCKECGPCMMEIKKIVPKCRHPQIMKCSENPAEFFCREICQKALSCGHLCRGCCGECVINKTHSPCRQKCEKVHSCGHKCPLHCCKECGPCMMEIKKIVPKCQHPQIMKCSENPAEFFCREICQKALSCGHLCRGCCGECVINETHSPCRQKCEKVLSCGHTCLLQCYKECGPCQVKVKKIVPRCQHICKIKCSDNPAEFCCLELCKKTLPCGHLCSSFCGQCIINETHSPCRQKCEKVNSCGHKCLLHCYEECGPCQVKVKKIVPRCQHICKMKCSDNPAEFHCLELCKKTLPCGHFCSGSCGKCIIHEKHSSCIWNCKISIHERLSISNEVTLTKKFEELHLDSNMLEK